MITQKQLKILGIFGKNVFKEYTFKEIKTITKEKSNSFIQNSIRKFIKENLVYVRKIGTSKIYTLNHENYKIYEYISVYNQDKIPQLVRMSIKHVKEALDKEISFYSLVIFGSYAKGDFSKDSDLDIAIFIPDKKYKKKAEIALNSASNKSILKLDYHIISESEFRDMLKSDNQNLGKEIAGKNLPIYNASIFYRLLMRYTWYGSKTVY